MTKDEVLKLALEALEGIHPGNMTPMAEEYWNKAITVIKEALAQPAPVQEPVAWMYQCSADSSGPVLMQYKKDWAESGSGLWTEAPLYTTPPAAQRIWVSLTDEERTEIRREHYARTLPLMDAVEAKLKEKNS